MNKIEHGKWSPLAAIVLATSLLGCTPETQTVSVPTSTPLEIPSTPEKVAKSYVTVEITDLGLKQKVRDTFHMEGEFTLLDVIAKDYWSYTGNLAISQKDGITQIDWLKQASAYDPYTATKRLYPSIDDEMINWSLSPDNPQASYVMRLDTHPKDAANPYKIKFNAPNYSFGELSDTTDSGYLLISPEIYALLTQVEPIQSSQPSQHQEPILHPEANQ